MFAHDIDAVRRDLPDLRTLTYYADRESPWLVSQLIDGDTKVGAISKSPIAKLLKRPLVRPVAALCGGVLRHLDMVSVSNAGQSVVWDRVTEAGMDGLEAAFSTEWHDFMLTFDVWGVQGDHWHWAQMSRLGGNLVIQLGFPSDHAELLGRHLGTSARHKFEWAEHPIRTEGRPTLAWSRVDLDRESGVALIEEIQTDWLREVSREVLQLENGKARHRNLRAHRAYEAELMRRYGKIWARAMMLATLMVLRDNLGIRKVFYHQMHAGAVLKHMEGDFDQPPRSVYVDLPKSFCFRPTVETPPFLDRTRRRDLNRLRRSGKPLFWLLDFDDRV